MNIKDVKTAFKIADVVLDKEHKQNHIKFVFLSELFDQNNQKLNKINVLKDKKGRVYIMTVDGVIKKIGGSMDKGGIKATMAFYQMAMQGRPGISRYGTHILIQKELEKKSKVEIYLITSKNIKTSVKGLFSDKSTVKEIAVFKEMEDQCKEDYQRKEGKYPAWNFQENGSAWPSYIQESHNTYLATRTGKKKKF